MTVVGAGTLEVTFMIKTAVSATLQRLWHTPRNMSEGRARSYSIAFQRPLLSQLSRTTDKEAEETQNEIPPTGAPDGGYGWFVALGQFLIKWLFNNITYQSLLKILNNNSWRKEARQMKTTIVIVGFYGGFLKSLTVFFVPLRARVLIWPK